MGKSERLTVTLMGGAPWGFRLIGGGALPLTINKIRKKTMAHTLGLQTGDAVLSINGVPVHDKTQDEAIDLMDKSGKKLTLEIFREATKRGDINDLNAAVEEKPKKPIWAQSKTQETVTTSEDGATTITTKVTSTTQSSTTEVVQGGGANQTLLISSDGNVSSEAFQQAVDEASQGLQLSFTGGEVTSSSFEQSSSSIDNSASLQLSFDVGDMSSNSFDQQSTAFDQGGLQLSFNEGEMSTNTFDQQSSEVNGLQLSVSEGETSTNAVEELPGGLQLSFTTSEEMSSTAPDAGSDGIVLSAAVDEVIAPTASVELESSPVVSSVLEDSGIQLDIGSMETSAVEVKDEGRILPIRLEEEVKDEGRILPIQLEQDIQVQSEPAAMATPFVDSTVIAEEPPMDVIPQQESLKPAKVLTPEPQIIINEAPKAPSPQPPPQIYSPVPQIYSPQPMVAQPEPEISSPLNIVSNIQVLESPAIQPANTVTTTSHESFDDGMTRREITEHVTTSNDGLSSTMVRQETSSTVSTQQMPGFMQSQESAFSSFQAASPVQVTRITASVGAVESPPPPAEIPTEVSSFSMQSMVQAEPQPQQEPTFSTTKYQPVQAPQPKYQAPAQAPPVYQPVAQPTYQAPPPQQPVYQPVAQPSYQAPPVQQPVYEPVAQPTYQAPPVKQPVYTPVAQPKFQAAPPTAPKPQPKPQPVQQPVQPPPPQSQYATLPNPARPQPPTTISSSYSTHSLDRHTPSFRPSKFVPGFQNREIPGLYSPQSPKIEIDLNTETQLYSADKPPAMQPMFQVRNFVASTNKPTYAFKPNMWLPGQKPPSRQPSRAPTPQSMIEECGFQKDFETFPVPKVKKENRLTIAQRKEALKNQPMHITRIEDFKHLVDHDDDADDGLGFEEDEVHVSPTHFDRTHLFAPPVEIHARAAPQDALSPGDEDEYYYYEEGTSPTSSMLRRKKAQYADSAFYDTPGKHYPTIDEQMKLCRAISTSLTSAANRRARGAKMFLRRKKKANKWVHEGEPGWSSEGGDVAEIHELESELQIEDGGSKPLFYFKIPNLKNRVQEGESPKMSLSQDQFERLRLTAKKCDHRAVPAESCFDIAADLKKSKGRGGRLFEKRKARSDQFVIDNSHLTGVDPKSRLENVLTAPIKQQATPWEAAAHHAGNVEPAFAHLTQMEQNQKLNQYMKISQKKHAPVQPVVPSPTHMPPMPAIVNASLKGEGHSLLKGEKFNRTARGWGGGGEYPVAECLTHVPAPKGTPLSENFGDYNNKVRAWNGPGQSPYVSTPNATPARGPSPYVSAPQPAPVRPVQKPYSAPQPDYNYRAQPEWQAHDPETEAMRSQGMVSSYSSSYYEPVAAPQPSSAPRSRQLSGYGSTVDYDAGSTSGRGQGQGQYGTVYKEEYGYNYLPVDNKFGSGDYNSFNEVKPMYMQPIIPGTDL